MKIVSLLCRGKSLEHIDMLPKPDRCVLVNAFHFELNNKNVHEHVLDSPAVSHVVSLGSFFKQMIHDGVYEQYNFDEIIVPYIKEVCPGIPGYLCSIKGNNGILPVSTLSDNNKKDMVSTARYKFTSPSCGLDALLYAINDLKSDIINIIGLDFYDNVGYLTNSYGRRLDENTTEDVVRRMRGSDHDATHMIPFFLKVVNDHPEVQFNLYTKSEIQSDNLNLKITRV